MYRRKGWVTMKLLPYGKKGRFSFEDVVFSLTFRDRVIAQGDLG